MPRLSPTEVSALGRMGEGDLLAYLTAHSGLPGPRGNLELADAFARVADLDVILHCVHMGDEYLRCCGTQAVGRLVVEHPADGALVALLHERATDVLWRVREAAARALQVVGDGNPDQMRTVVAEWIRDPNAYVRRAVIAAISEPRLLQDPLSLKAALDGCTSATASLVALPASERKSEAARNLRQALGYCWSVVIAADPGAGLPAFAPLRKSTDPDVAWIVKSNLSKARLRRLLT